MDDFAFWLTDNAVDLFKGVPGFFDKCVKHFKRKMSFLPVPPKDPKEETVDDRLLKKMRTP